MENNKTLKQKIKENKGKIIAGFVIASGISYVIMKQNSTIHKLQLNDIKQQEDIDVLTSVMSENVLSSLKATLTRKLRYAEGRLSNGIKNMSLSEEDEKLRMEEIEFFSKELNKILKAEKILSERTN